MPDGSVIIDTKLDKDGIEKGANSLKNAFGKIESIAKTACKGVAIAVGTIATAFAGVVTASVKARGELEQQVGGVKTLFVNELGDASETVIQNANKAYKTAGMSAIDYMSTATSISASLLKSLGEDTAEAAEATDRAIIDMSDNANKMGTDISLIQNAYQGFAKQNYTMLDNLKLGYGGTKEQMELLISDAAKMTDIQDKLNVTVKDGDMGFANIVNAIHVMQEYRGILGTTAEEATETLQGSMSSLSASWNNFLSGSGGLGQVVETATDVVENIVRIVNESIPQIIQGFVESFPQLLELGGQLIEQLINGITEYLPQLIPAALNAIQQFILGILDCLPQLLETGITVLAELIKGIAQMLPELIPKAIDCIITLVETLLDNIDLLIDAGIQLILSLADGLIDAVPRLIDKIPVIIEKLINAFIENYPKMFDAGMQLIMKLATGFVQSIPQMWSCAGKVMQALLSGLGSAMGKLVEAGGNLVKGIWQGISNAVGWIWDKISGFCNSIVSKIKGFFGIHSPSKLFNEEIGQNLGLGLGEGFNDSLKSVYKDMQKAVEYENAKLTSNLTSTHQIQVTNEDNRQARLESIDNNKEITVNSVTNLDSKVIARETNKVNTKQKLQYGIA